MLNHHNLKKYNMDYIVLKFLFVNLGKSTPPVYKYVGKSECFFSEYPTQNQILNQYFLVYIPKKEIQNNRKHKNVVKSYINNILNPA